MSRNLSPELLAELFGQVSTDPFLMLVTLEHENFPSPVRLVNNVKDIVSRGETYTAFPMTITLPVDDGETERTVQIEFDNTGLELIDEIRSGTDPIDASIEMILASNPDTVQVEVGELKVREVKYTAQKITATLFLDDFLNTEVAFERYTPTNFPGLF